MATLKIVELHFRDPQTAAVWFCQHFQLNVVMDSVAEQYTQLDAGALRLAFKGDSAAQPTLQAWLQWEVDNVEAWLQTTGAEILKPLKISAEGYRRIVVKGPEGMPILVYDWMKPLS